MTPTETCNQQVIDERLNVSCCVCGARCRTNGSEPSHLSELHEYIYCFNVILICSASSAMAASYWCNEPHQNPEQVWFWSNM